MKQNNADLNGALQDFRHCLELVDENHLRDYASIAIWIIGARKGEKVSATEEFSAYLSKRNERTANDWEVTISRFLLDQIKEMDFFAAAASSNAHEESCRRCDAYYYVGMKHLLNGDKAKAADFFRQCLATKKNVRMQYCCAAAELKKLGQ